MALVFETQPGYAFLVPGPPGGDPLTVDVAGFGGGGAMKSIITQLSIRRGANAQFVHTLQDLIYVNVFGERIGSITAAGLSFVGLCNGGGKTGIELVLEWYEANRLGGGRSGPLQILIGGAGGGVPFKGYLVGLEVDVVKPDLRLANFAFQFQTLPQRRR